jgi:hypothetical protein
MDTIPLFIALGFGVTVMITLFLFWRSARFSTYAIIATLLWTFLQAAISAAGFYLDVKSMPPRLMLAVLPAFAVTACMFFSAHGKKFIDRLDLQWLVLLHAVRILVELVLFGLFQHKGVPELMTFEGRNFDILSGVSALVVFWLMRRHKINRSMMIAWNIAGLLLLANIVVHAILAAPYPFQQIAFDQPNRAVLHFPFLLLPAVIVPLVLFAHLASLRLLLKQQEAASLQGDELMFRKKMKTGVVHQPSE